MSYRTIKKLLGETSLERKCRFLFGGGLMMLITGSFYLYAHRNAELVHDQSRTTARLLIAPVMVANHSKFLSDDNEKKSADEPVSSTDLQFQRAIENIAVTLKPDELPEYGWDISRADPLTADATSLPFDDRSYEALQKIRSGDDEVIVTESDEGEYHYFRALRAKKSCIACHNDAARFPDREDPVVENDLLGMAHIQFPLDDTQRALAWNNAILLTTAIVTAFLAMLAAWAIVRYVIVKPVLHLKDVSDEISRGNLDLRADIRTGDEFEELSHAFNRMLRHLVNMQEDLREAYAEKDEQMDELAQVNLRLFEMNKLKDEFLATMSHELRTPLNSILGFSDVLSNAKNMNDRQQRYLKNIERSGRELMALINDLLDVAKIESGKMELHLERVAAGDLIEQQTSLMQHMADQKNIHLGFTVDRTLPVLLQDPGKIGQILNNLLSNALKFTPEGGQVRVKVRRLGDHFEIIVEDTGIGIPLEDQATIFEKFRQGRLSGGERDALTREFGGTGLGLSIVKELSKLLGGEVELQSEFGKGSVFTVRLPIELHERPPQLSESEPMTAALPRPNGSETV